MCIVAAVAGWGKTSTVRRAGRGGAVVWVAHDEVHRLGGLASGRSGVTAVVDDIQDLPSDSPMAGALHRLCAESSPRVRLVLISRSTLPFPVQRLRGRGLLSEVGAAELHFRRSELIEVAREALGEVHPATLSRIWSLTGGWPALTARLVERLAGVRPEQHSGLLQRVQLPGEFLQRFVAEEVVGPEPPETVDLLRRLALCERHAGRCTDLRSGEALPDLVRRGLVTHRADGGWALSAPVRMHLRHELESSPGIRKQLHRQLCTEFAERGAPAHAVRHGLAAGDVGAVRDLVARNGAALVHGGDAAAVRQIAAVPAEWAREPALDWVVGEARQVVGRWAGAGASFRRAGSEQPELTTALGWRVGVLAYARGEFGEVRSICARTALAGENTADEAKVLALSATTHRMTGDYPAARSLAERSLRAAERSGDAGALGEAYLAAAHLAYAEGDTREFGACLAGAREAAEAAGDALQQLRALVIEAGFSVQLRSTARAVETARAAVRLGRRCGDNGVTALAMTVRAHALLRRGDGAAARRDFEQAAAMFEQLGSRLGALPLSGLGDVHRLHGQCTRARAAYEQALSLAEPVHDVVGMSGALAGWARVCGPKEPEAARNAAERAVRLDEGIYRVHALTTRGWVSLCAGDRQSAAQDAVRAAEVARARCDEPGLAETVVLGALSAEAPGRHQERVLEAAGVWRDLGMRADEAVAEVVASRLSGADSGDAVLAGFGIDARNTAVAGPLAASARKAPPVAISTLGTFEVRRHGELLHPAAWQSRKARELVKMLVAHRRPVSRERLMELLWPGGDPGRCGNRMSVLLNTVREALRFDAAVVTDGGSVWFDRSLVDIDVENFLSLAADACAGEDGDRLARLLAAARAHPGGFLEQDPCQEWAVPLAEEVRTTYAAVLRALAAELRETGDVDEAARYLVRLLDLDPYDETAHLTLVATLDGAGRFGAARSRYQAYLDRMAEIEVPPSPFPARRAPRTGSGRASTGGS
ncbi:tetratricopeptide repeat protein [Amycolatopsis jejuensis]|uniref:tetratricopeptide repeat protein n=1 Tax=Amycolatopsis jejuensis TaxID=330084 RepID=UPI000A06882B|nr:tetratricopeptide repeat protein [Amycolatopsis jejuensis]